MRDRLMETKQTGQKRPPQKHDYSHWSGYAPSDKRSRKYTPKNDSTQFVNFMRDKLMEAMDDFDRATLSADERARKTGEHVKLPDWKKDYAPKGKPLAVISGGKLHRSSKKPLKVSKGRRTPMIKRLNKK